MRLLAYSDDGEFSLAEFFDDDIPEYAILSHRWGSEEVTFIDLINRMGKSKAGYGKIQFCGEQARRDGLQYFWLAEAINSMFRWYRNAAKCYVYLLDVSRSACDAVNKSNQLHWESTFRNSKWFTRGWTLQELIAPAGVEFFSKEGELLGNKTSLERHICEVTGISVKALRGGSLSDFSVTERMSWSEKRETTRKEDTAYSLLGIFDVNIPLIYGEGREKALKRLREEIDKASRGRSFSSALEDEMTQLLDAIPKLPYGERHRNLQLTRMEGAGQWILGMPKFLHWKNTLSSDSTLWCNGAPGAGKTYLASLIIDHLHEFTVRNDQSVLFFYFDYKLQSEQTPLKFIQTLLHQLLSTFSQVPKEVLELSQSVKKREDLPSWKVLTSVFLDICNHSRDVFIVLDALDECDKVDNRGPVVDFIRDIKRSKARLIVTSRPYPADIDDLLGRCSQILVEASDADIRAYILDRIARTRQVFNIIDTKLRDEIVQSIASKSQGMFLLPALQINNILGQTNKTQIKKALEALPSGLGDNLLLTIERIKSQHPYSKTRANLALTVLMWLSTVRRPMTVHELQHAIATDPESKKLGDITNAEFYVDCCFGLVIIDETSVIRLVHFSVSEFLEEQRDELFESPDGVLATSCLSYMLLFVKSRDYLRNKVNSTKTYPAWPFLDYSIRYWGMHARKDHTKSESPALIKTKAQEFCSSSSAINFWAQTLKDKALDVSWNEDRDWLTAAKYVTPTLSNIHIAVIYGLATLVQDQLERQPTVVRCRDANGATPLMLAAAGGCINTVELLMTSNLTEVNAQDISGRTALWYAIDQKQYPVVRQLLNSTCHLVDINVGGSFAHLCENVSPWGTRGGEDLLRLFLTRAELDVNGNDSQNDGEPPWFILAKHWYFDILQELVANPKFNPWRSGRPNHYHEDYYNYHRNTDYDSSLNTVQEMCDVPAIIQLLDSDPRFDFEEFYALDLLWPFVYYAFTDLEPIDHRQIDWMGIWDDEQQTWKYILQDSLESRNISFETRDSTGRGFLHYLAKVGGDVHRQGHLEFLLQRLPTDLKDKRGRTPLHVAAQNGHEDVVRQLLSAGANPLAVDEDGMSVLHYAAESSNIDMLQLLIENEANVNAKGNHGESILHKAAINPNSTEEIILFLIGLGVPIADEDDSGRTPLHIASYSTVEVFTVLLEYGANPSGWNSMRGTPLIDAVIGGDSRIVKLCLSKYEGDLNTLDSFGMSVFDYLSLHGPSVAEDFGFTPSMWSTYKPVEPAERRARILSCLQKRLELMILSNDRGRRSLGFRTGFQLLKLGDDTAARIMFEADIALESKSGSPYFPNDLCQVCHKDEVILFKCKTCPFNWLCKDCRDNKYPVKGLTCSSHDFLQVPGDDWKDLPIGMINRQGQEFGGWLAELHKRYMAIK